MNVWTNSRALVALFVLGFSGACALLLALPGETVSTKFVNDLVIFLDGAHRVVWGQVPNRDFHTPMGALAYLMPAAGLWLSGAMGGALPVGMALTILAFAPAVAYALASRLRPVLGLPLAAYLILILAAPLNVGDTPENLSFAMFYNRIGWAGLGLLLVLYLPTRPGVPERRVADAVCAAFAVLVLVYTKASYGLVALGLLGWLLLDPTRRRWSGLALVVTVAVGLGVEAVWRSSAAYIADLRLAGEVSGALWGGVERLVEAFRANLLDYVLYGMVVAGALSVTLSVRDLMFYGFSAVAGLLLLNQNYQLFGVVTLGVAGALAAEVVIRAAQLWNRWGVAASFAACLAVLGLIGPEIVQRSRALGAHVALALRPPARDFGLPRFDTVRLAAIGTPGDLSFGLTYIATLEDGARALAALDTAPSHVFVMDFVNPFSAGLGLEPPRGDSSWHHASRTFDAAHFIPPEQMFRDVRIIMDPKEPVEGSTADELRIAYRDYLAVNFDLALETEYWRIHLPRGPVAGRKTPSAGAS